VLNRFDAVAVVVGSIIGSGIFLKGSQVAAGLQSFALEVFVWIFVGLVILCGSLALGELAALLPHAGGPYVYLREAYGRVPAFLWGWTEFWVIRSGSLGALACATVIYLNEIIPMNRLMQPILAISLVVGLSLVNAAGTRWGASVQNVTSVIKVGFLLLLITVPWLVGRAEPENLQPVLPAQMSTSLLGAIGIAMIAVMWPYDGWINIAPVAEEIREPQRNVPFALCTGMLIVIGVYVGAITSYHLVLPMEQMAQSSAVAADTCRALFGETGAVIAAVGVICSTFGACNANMLTGPRIYFAMARDGLLPASVRGVHARFRTPANAILLQGLWSSVLIAAAYAWKSQPGERPTAAFDTLTDLVIFGGSLFYAMAVAAVFVLRRKYPDRPRPYRAWGYPFTPLLYLLAFAAVLLSLLLTKTWQETTIGLLLIASGYVYYQFAIKFERGSQHGNEGHSEQ
jgi:APA family basic amino acid/polyamine antiporter